MKTIIWILGIVVVVLAAFLLLNTYIYNEKQAPEPALPETETPAENDEPAETDEREIVGDTDSVRIESPQAGVTITSPVEVSGEARGTWFFEASFPVTVTDWDGRIIGEGYVTATDDWMTEDFVSFTGEVEFTLPADTPYKRGLVILQKDNPSGLPENAAAVEIPVLFE